MTTEAILRSIIDDDDPTYYPNHEEDDVPEGTLHDQWRSYMVYALAAHYPDRFVAGNICAYWEKGNTRAYLGPDAFVAAGPVGKPPPRVYRMWRHPQIVFAAEIGSQHNTRAKIREKRGRYHQFLRPTELLETIPIDEEEGEQLTPAHLQLYQWTEQGYVEVAREANGRFRSRELELEIGVDEQANLRLYTLSGEPLLTYEEEQRARLAAQAELVWERSERAAMELRAATEARERTDAERRAQELEQQRAAVEEQLGREVRERATAEQRAQEAEERAAAEANQRLALERELAELRARLADGKSHS